jgi:hypothetical protein
MVILLESTVSVTTRQSDNAPTASEAAMALVNQEDATGAGRPSKPAVPDDRIMVQILTCAGESPTASGAKRRNPRWQYCGGTGSNSGEIRAGFPVLPAVFGVLPAILAIQSQVLIKIRAWLYPG